MTWRIYSFLCPYQKTDITIDSYWLSMTIVFPAPLKARNGPQNVYFLHLQIFQRHIQGNEYRGKYSGERVKSPGVAARGDVGATRQLYGGGGGSRWSNCGRRQRNNTLVIAVVSLTTLNVK